MFGDKKKSPLLWYETWNILPKLLEWFEIKKYQIFIKLDYVKF